MNRRWLFNQTELYLELSIEYLKCLEKRTRWQYCWRCSMSLRNPRATSWQSDNQGHDKCCTSSNKKQTNKQKKLYYSSYWTKQQPQQQQQLQQQQQQKRKEKQPKQERRSNNLCLSSRRHHDLKHFGISLATNKKWKAESSSMDVREGQNNLSPPSSPSECPVLFHPMPRSIQCGVHTVVV